MSYILLKSSSFEKSAKKYLKKLPLKRDVFTTTLKLLSENPFNPLLKTHKLHGKLDSLWASHIDFSYRILFKFVKYEAEANTETENNAILLVNIGSHDEVY